MEVNQNIFMLFVLAGAVLTDICEHRIPNYLVLIGLGLGGLAGLGLGGLPGLLEFAKGVVIGLACFMPFYLMAGMSAGDVKLMAVVGGFTGAQGAFWVAAYSLVFGCAFGVFYLLYKGQFARLVGRYWMMARTLVYVPAQVNDAARKRFPFSMAIAAGAVTSLYWTPL